MRVRSTTARALLGGLVLGIGASAWAEEIRGRVKSVDAKNQTLVITADDHKEIAVRLIGRTRLLGEGGEAIVLSGLKEGTPVVVSNDVVASTIAVEKPKPTSEARPRSILEEFWHNFTHNLFKPLLLFFYMGFLVTFLRVKFEFPYVMYQALTIFLLISIGWHGGEELAELKSSSLGPVLGFMAVGFVTNSIIGVLAYGLLNAMTTLRRVDKATVAGYYGSDSAGTFVTCLGVLTTANILYDAYMPVMLAVMEIPGCLVALYLISRLRGRGMDALGNMPDEPGYDPTAKPARPPMDEHGHVVHVPHGRQEMSLERTSDENDDDGGAGKNGRNRGVFDAKLLHEVFLNPGLYLLFGGIIIGFISRKQGPQVTRDDDNFFNVLFQGVLCLFLLEMGMTASRKLKDLATAGPGFVFYGLLAPNLFATLGIFVAHAYAVLTGTHFELGTYVLFAVLSGAASYIAVPAVQRMAIPEASPTLPLAASLGLTFSYNVTVGIPIYIELAKLVRRLY